MAHRFNPRRRRILLAAPGMLLMSCGSGNTSPSPAALALQSAVSQIDTYATRALVDSGVPGMALAIVHEDQVLHLKGYGIRKTGSAALIDIDTVFQLASVSKPIASTVMASLAGSGLIGWDDTIRQHDPGFMLSNAQASQAVTLRDMFCHRSGLADHAGDLLEDIGYGRDEILSRLRYLPLGKRFRNTYAYTNFGLSEAAYAAARSAGMPWEDLAQARLFDPAGMQSASYRHADYLARSNRAWLHVNENGKFVAKYDRDPDAQSPAGGASASIRDMARWLQLQLTNGSVDGAALIPAAALQETRQAQIEAVPASLSPSDRAEYYALGWNLSLDSQGRARNGHSGAFALGASTCVQLAPDQGLGIVVLTNGWPLGLPEAVAATFMELALDGAVSRDWLPLFRQGVRAQMNADFKGPTDYSQPPTQPAPAQPASAYVGRYDSAYYGSIEFVEQGGALTLLLGPQQTAYAMRHWSGDQFVFQPSGENAVEFSGVMFAMGNAGKAARVRIEYLDQKAEGDFARVGV